MTAQFGEIHPELRALLLDLATWCEEQHIRSPVVTELARDRAKQIHYYVSHWTKLKLELVTSGLIGHGNESDEYERQATKGRNIREAQRLLKRRHASEDLLTKVRTGAVLESEERMRVASLLRGESLLEEAQKRFTWHECLCAADLRSKNYTGTELDRVMSYLAAKAKPPGAWELVRHDLHGRHIHVARCAMDWRERFQNSKGAGHV